MKPFRKAGAFVALSITECVAVNAMDREKSNEEAGQTLESRGEPTKFTS
jgi:hypothetical protein